MQGTSILAWSPAEDLYTGVENARYRLFDRMRHYYRWNETTRRWEIEFRIADAGLDAPDQNLIQWLILRASGYYLLQPHLYGAAPVEMKPWLGGWKDHEQVKQQLCIGLKAEFSPGKTRGQRLEELGHVSIEWIGDVGFGEYGVFSPSSLSSSLRTAKEMASEVTCPDPPAGVVTIHGTGPGAGVHPGRVRRGAVRPQRRGRGQRELAVEALPGGDHLPGRGLHRLPGHPRRQRPDLHSRSGGRGPVSAGEGHLHRRPAVHQDGLGPDPKARCRSSPGKRRLRRNRRARPFRRTRPWSPTASAPATASGCCSSPPRPPAAESADIADYNAFAQARAAANANLADFSGRFTALISTASVNIKDNTATTGLRACPSTGWAAPRWPTTTPTSTT